MYFFVREKKRISYLSPQWLSRCSKFKKKRRKSQADDNRNKDKEKEPLITAFREQRLLLLDGCVWMKVGGILAWNQITPNFSEIKSYLGHSVLFTCNLARIGLSKACKSFTRSSPLMYLDVIDK